MLRDQAVNEKGRRGVLIAKKLWPQLQLVEEGSDTDKDGADAVMRSGDFLLQIKTDETIATTGNLYVEYYEKTAGKPSQAWRHSPVKGQAYIFVTKGKAIWVKVDTIAKAANGLRVTAISGTSMGILIPLKAVVALDETVRVVPHDLWNQHMLL